MMVVKNKEGEGCNSSEKTTTGETQLPIMRWKASDARDRKEPVKFIGRARRGTNIMFSGQLIRRRGRWVIRNSGRKNSRKGSMTREGTA